MAWAGNNGSELLKARINGRFEWVGLAEQEFAASIVAGMGEVSEDPATGVEDTGDRTTPTLEEIRALEAAHKLLDGKPAEVQLFWVKYETDDDGETVQRCELIVTVTCPTGRDIEYSYLPESVKAGSV